MISCELNGKKYTVDFISGRALREIGPAAKMYARVLEISQEAIDGKPVDENGLTIEDALDVMVQWFCLLFGNQFTPDELYDGYPADRIPDRGHHQHGDRQHCGHLTGIRKTA